MPKAAAPAEMHLGSIDINDFKQKPVVIFNVKIIDFFKKSETMGQNLEIYDEKIDSIIIQALVCHPYINFRLSLGLAL